VLKRKIEIEERFFEHCQETGVKDAFTRRRQEEKDNQYDFIDLIWFLFAMVAGYWMMNRLTATN